MRTWRFILSAVCLLFFSKNSEAQKTTPNEKDIQYIFLDLADSTGGMTIYNNARHPKASRQARLELMYRKPVIFKIKNINPLRFNYFLNDELVTNFFDGNAVTTATGLRINGNNTVKEIPAINIFTFDVIPESNVEDKFAIKDIKKEIESIRTQYYSFLDSLDKVDREIVNTPGYATYYVKGDTTNSNIQKGLEQKLLRYDDALFKLTILERKLTRKLSELHIVLNASNDKDVRILTDSAEAQFQNVSALFPTILRSKLLVNNMNNDLKALDSIINLVQKIQIKPHSNRRYNQESQMVLDTTHQAVLLQLLEKYNYIHENTRRILAEYAARRESGVEFADEKLKILEFVFNKKYKIIETCILNNSLQVGKLMEEKWIEYSRDRNTYLNKASITQKDLDSIAVLRKEITLVFNYVKKWIADFALLNQSAKLDNKIFKSVHENILLNCTKFLDFLRDLDHLTQPNTIEYTSPIYDNLKNVDILRFKVDKQDKVTAARQTYDYDMWIKGGIKIDFSVGFLASALTDRQYNKVAYYIPSLDSTIIGGNTVYKYNNIPNTDSFYITESRNGNFSFCFGGMVNLMPRNGTRWVNVGGSLGVAYSTNQKLQALAGFSLHFGKTERIILHGGVAFGTIKVLDKSRLTLLEPVTDKVPDRSYFVRGNLNEFTIPEIERFTVRPFFGISYNLSKQNSLQAIKSQGGQQYYKSELQ